MIKLANPSFTVTHQDTQQALHPPNSNLHNNIPNTWSSFSVLINDLHSPQYQNPRVSMDNAVRIKSDSQGYEVELPRPPKIFPRTCRESTQPPFFATLSTTPPFEILTTNLFFQWYGFSRKILISIQWRDPPRETANVFVILYLHPMFHAASKSKDKNTRRQTSL